jgi:membrane-bound lytic murein transglycosylase D
MNGVKKNILAFVSKILLLLVINATGSGQLAAQDTNTSTISSGLLKNDSVIKNDTTLYTYTKRPLKELFSPFLNIRSKSNDGLVTGVEGPWQFVPAISFEKGLFVNKYMDEKDNYNLSKTANERYIAELYSLVDSSNTRIDSPIVSAPVAALSDSDIVLKKDTVLKIDPVVLNDPKLGFKDLFENVGTSSYNNGAAKLNPLAISFVDDYIKKYGKKMNEIKGWGRPYFNLMDAILTQYGIPKEMKYLAVIESNLQPYAVSWVGAVGPWQFMPGTARDKGLMVNMFIDERIDYYKSTRAAARYLNELYSMYGDWLLVIAAYNGGPGNVNSAIRRSGSRNFWRLQNFLPTESKNHVKKFIATHYIMEGGGGLTTLTKEETKEFKLESSSASNLNAEEIANSKTFTITGKYNSAVIAKYTMMDITSFNKYNPNFDNILAAGNNFEMRLPTDKMDLFNARRYEILNESIQLLLNSVNIYGSPLPAAAPKTKTTTKTTKKKAF